MDLNNRELAVLFWLGVLLAWGLAQPKMRASVWGVVRAALHPKLAIPVVGAAAYVAAVCALANRVGLWTPSLTKETLFWFLVSGMVLLARFQDITRGEPFLRKAAVITILGTVAIEFVMNLFVLSLWAELLLQPLVAVLAMTLVVVKRDPKYEPAKKVLDVMFAGIGIAMGGFAIWNLIANWRTLEMVELLRELVLPLWLGIAVIPIVYLIAVFAAYDSAFVRLRWLVKDGKCRKRVKVALATTFLPKVSQLASFGVPWANTVADQDSLRAARAELRRYREVRTSER